MDYSEKEIEDILVDSNILYDTYGVEVISSQFRTQYGVIDILGYDPVRKQIVIVELKKGIVDENAVGQIMRYIAAINELQNTFKDMEDAPEHMKGNYLPYGILMGASATDGVHAIVRNFQWVKFAEVYVDLRVSAFDTEYRCREHIANKEVEHYLSSEASDAIEELFQKQIIAEKQADSKEEESLEQAGE